MCSTRVYLCLSVVLLVRCMSAASKGVGSDPTDLRAILTRFIQSGPGASVGAVASASVASASQTVTRAPIQQWNYAPAGAAAASYSSAGQRLGGSVRTSLGQGIINPSASHTQLHVGHEHAVARSRSMVASGSGALARSSPEDLHAWLSETRNPGTSRTYASGWAGFERYLSVIDVNENDATENDVAGYLRWRVMEQRVANSTVQSDRASIADHWRHDPLRKHLAHAPIVKEVMGVLRTQAAPSKPKQHMGADLMRCILKMHDAAVQQREHSGTAAAASSSSAASRSSWLEERNVCMLLLMMMGMLREGEAAALRQDDIEVKDLLVDNKRHRTLQIFIVKSKTDQEKRGAVVVLCGNPKEPTFCPVARWERYQRALEEAGVRSPFAFPKQDLMEMSSGTPNGLVQRAVGAANAQARKDGHPDDYRWGDPLSYGSHSLRRGGVTAARQNGVSMLDIQRHGRWKSLTVFGYVGLTAQEQISVSKAFLSSPYVEEPMGTETPVRWEREGIRRGRREMMAAKVKALAEAPLADDVPTMQAGMLNAANASQGSGRQRGRDVDEASDEEEESLSQEEIDGELAEDVWFAEQCSQDDPGDDKSKSPARKRKWKKPETPTRTQPQRSTSASPNKLKKQRK